jgi:hypothetical protein
MEFYISGSVHGESGFLSIIGCCGDEPIAPGTEFRAMFRLKPRHYPDGLESPREVEECRNIHLVVQAVEAYGKSLDVLPANTTGVLRCFGSSIERVPGGWVLTDQCIRDSDRRT